jgi:flagellar hook-associated protein 3 FlgL
MRQSMLLHAHSAAINDYTNNIDRSTGFLRTADVAFSSAVEVLHEVRLLALQGGNDTESPESRQALAAAVDGALTRMVDIGNTTHDGRFVFAGTATTTAPFRLDDARASVSYQGTQDTVSVQISPTTATEISNDGFAIFQEQTDMFAVLVRLREALRANDAFAIRDMVGQVDNAQQQLNNAYGALGGRERMLEMTLSQITAVQLNLDDQASQIEDADLTKVITEFQSAQVALQAGLEAGARVMQTSLLDYLR